MRRQALRQATWVIRRNWDELSIVAALGKIASNRLEDLTMDDQLILQAFRRSTNVLRHADMGEIGAYLQSLDEDAIVGVSSNVKGILHELLFVQMENEDGDPVVATLFQDTNHMGTDVSLVDTATGGHWELQLKATDNSEHVQDWFADHPGDEIAITNELAERMDLPASGISNAEITMDVERFIDRVLEHETLWDSLSVLSAASAAIALGSLYMRFVRGEIAAKKFLTLAVTITGWKAAKMAALCAALSVPVVNVATGAGVAARLIYSLHRAFEYAESGRLE